MHCRNCSSIYDTGCHHQFWREHKWRRSGPLPLRTKQRIAWEVRTRLPSEGIRCGLWPRDWGHLRFTDWLMVCKFAYIPLKIMEERQTFYLKKWKKLQKPKKINFIFKIESIYNEIHHEKNREKIHTEKFRVFIRGISDYHQGTTKVKFFFKSINQYQLI